MVGVTIALFLTAAAVLFVRHETRLLGVSSDRLDMIQGSRAALDLISDDLRKAGVGVGYDEQGDFSGLLLGQFQAGGVTWNPDGTSSTNPQPVPPGQGAYRRLDMQDTSGGSALGGGALWESRNVEIGIRYADGVSATVANWSPGLLELCRVDDDDDGNPDAITNQFNDPDIVVLRDDSYMTAQVVQISNLNAAPCTYGQCVHGCLSAAYVTWPGGAGNATFSTGAAVNSVSYVGGEVHDGYKTIVWFVAADANGFGTLRRAEFDGDPGNTCAAADNTCGGGVARGIETLQMQVWQWNPTPAPGAWVNVGQGPLTNPTPGEAPPRMRVDVEIVVRAEGTDVKTHPQVTLRLRDGFCAPTPCNAGSPEIDYTERRAYRTSVEIKNAGFMVMLP
jgi:hypothetical protein